MISLTELHTKLKKIVLKNPDFKYSLFDFYLKSQYEQYVSAIQSKNGRKFCISCPNIEYLKNQINKIILLSDTVVFTTTDFDKKPTLDVFPFPRGFNTDLIRIMTASEEGTEKSFIPNVEDMLNIIGLTISDEKLEFLHNSILGYDVDNPKNSYQRNQFYLSASIHKDKNGNEQPMLVGLTEKYSDSLYQFIFKDADTLFTDGNIVFSPFLRTSGNINNTMYNVLKAGALNTNFFVFDSRFSENPCKIDILENIAIPYIENVSIQTLSKIIKDEGESLASFRNKFQRVIEDIQDQEDSEKIKREMKHLKRDLFEDELEEVEKLCKKVIKMKTLSSVGAVVTTGIISVSAYFGLDIASIIMAAGTTGYATANELYNHYLVTQELKKNPMYFIWKIKSKK